MNPRAVFACYAAAFGCKEQRAAHDAGPVDPSDAAVVDARPDADAGCALIPPPLPACAQPVAGRTITMRLVHDLGVANGGATLVTAPVNDPRLFILEKAGIIRIIEGGALLPTPFLDLSEIVSFVGMEPGLLGLAFHPAYACNRSFYVAYSSGFDDVIAACTVSTANPNVADPTCTPILTVPGFANSHFGGMLAFGADGYLYVGVGDGSGQGDPMRLAQDPASLRGKLLRIDVDAPSFGKAYSIPADNPYANGGGAPEVFMVGLRNPWRWSFDRETQDLWIADVGGMRTEELDVLRPSEQKGANLGWSRFEGNVCCAQQDNDCEQSGPQYSCDLGGVTFPKFTHAHSSGWTAIIGGSVYRGSCYADLVGSYFYTDYRSANAGLHRARLLGDGTLEVEAMVDTMMPDGASSLNADARGELYLTTVLGRIYHLEAGP